MFEMKDLGRLTTPIRAAARVVAAGALFLGLLGAAPASAQVARAVTANFAPLTDNTSPDKKGLIHDLVLEMMKLQKITTPIEFMAWPDAVKIAEETPNAIIFPMTRTPQREDKYVWLVKAFDLNRSFAGKPGSAAINTVEDAKKLKGVGTTVNSASLNFLKQKGLTNIVEFATSNELMKGLLDGKIDVAYQPDPFSKADWKAVGGTGALVFGEPQERSAAYLAANKASTLKPADWQDALQVLELGGFFEQAVKAYGMD